MDFSLIERHPWWTTGIVIGGGFLVYELFHRSSGGGGAVVQQTSAGPSDAQVAADAQSQAIAAQLTGLQIQGQTQISLAQIGAGVSSQQISAAQDVTNNQTAAQVVLGQSTLQSQVDLAKVQAGVQMATLNALVTAFTGGGTTTPPATPATQNPVTNQPVVTPAYQITPPVPVSIAPTSPSFYQPNVPGPSTAPFTASPNDPNAAILASGGIIPGGTQLVPTPSYANCDPRDVACVMNNQTLGINWENETLSRNQQNNRDQCLANASLSVGKPNYAQLIAACG